MLLPEQILGFSMVSLLIIGFVAQLMQQRGGAVARAAPLVTIMLLLSIVSVAMVVLQHSLTVHGTTWTEAARNWQEEELQHAGAVRSRRKDAM